VADRFSTSLLALLIRSVPFEAGRWRLIPGALRRCQAVHTEQALRTIRTRHGFRMRVDISDWLGRHVYVTGEYEPDTTRVIK
jgi:hypothetical protein